MANERIFGFYDYRFYKGHNQISLVSNFDFKNLNNKKITIDDKTYILELSYNKSDDKYFGIISKTKDNSKCTCFENYDSNKKRNLKIALGLDGGISYDDTGRSYFVFEIKNGQLNLLCEINNIAGAQKINEFLNRYILQYKVKYSAKTTEKNRNLIKKMFSADVLSVELFTKDSSKMLLPEDDTCGIVSSDEIAEIKGYDFSFRINTRKDNKKKTTLSEICKIVGKKFSPPSAEEVFDFNNSDLYQMLNDNFKKAKVILYTDGKEEPINLLNSSDLYRLTIPINKKEDSDLTIKKELFEALNDRK